MSTPQGYNPIGQFAPGLPRHDGSLPGHVPGQYMPPADMSGSTQPDTNWSPSVGYRDPGFSPGFGLWSARIIMLCAVWISLPLQMGLYPLAGAVGLAAGFIVFAAIGGASTGFDGAMNIVWNAAYLSFLPLMRLETRLDTNVPAYRSLRHCLRLVLAAVAIFYLQVHEQQDPPVQAAVVAVIFAAIVHFLLRMKFARGMWAMFQTMAWLRKG